MATLDHESTPSKAAIGGHPLHPFLVPFPIAFLVGALVTDLVNRATGTAFWAQASYYLVVAGFITGVLAALAGFIDFVSRPQIRRLSIAWMHFLGNGAAMLLTLVNILLRTRDPVAPVSGAELGLSLLVTLIFLVTGWLGGEKVFRHRVGVTPDARDHGRALEERERRHAAGIRGARR